MNQQQKQALTKSLDRIQEIIDHTNEILDRIEQHASEIYVRDVKDGVIGSYRLTELSAEQTLAHVIRWIREGRSTINPPDEIGRPLKVSELEPDMVVVTKKETRSAFVTMWVVKITDDSVWFSMGDTAFIAKRMGADKEEITDDTGVRIMIYEYLAEI